MSKEHAYELHELTTDFRKLFLEEMALVAEAVYIAFNPAKLNYELLGNKEFERIRRKLQKAITKIHIEYEL